MYYWSFFLGGKPLGKSTYTFIPRNGFANDTSALFLGLFKLDTLGALGQALLLQTQCKRDIFLSSQLSVD